MEFEAIALVFVAYEWMVERKEEKAYSHISQIKLLQVQNIIAEEAINKINNLLKMHDVPALIGFVSYLKN